MHFDPIGPDTLESLRRELEEVEWLGSTTSEPWPAPESRGSEWLPSLMGAIGGATLYFYGYGR